MTRRLIALAALCAPLFGGYQYYYTDPLTTLYSAEWFQNGALAATSAGLTATDTNGGSLISKRAVPDTTSDYEVAATLKLAASGGTYVLYLRASSNALSGDNTAAGTYFAVEVGNLNCVSPTNCSSTIAVYKGISGIAHYLSSTPMPIHNGSLVRAVVSGGAMWISVDGLYVIWFSDVDLSGVASAGQPGIGGRNMPGSNSISLVQLGPLDRVAPAAVNSSFIGTSTFPTCVEMQWQGAADDANGIGIQFYDISRAITGIPESNFRLGVVYPAALEDCTVTPNASYTYAIRAIDFHNNYGPSTPVTVQTPDEGVINPRRIGVNALGNYNPGYPHRRQRAGGAIQL